MDTDPQVFPATARPGSPVDAATLASPGHRDWRRNTQTDLTQLRRFQWAVRTALALGVAASVCANVLHAQHNVIAQTIAAWPPLALMLTVELISRVPVHRRGLAALRILATTSIAGIAGYVSYFHMAAVVSRYGEHQPNPYLLPICVDGLIVVASVSLVELAGRARAFRYRTVDGAEPPTQDQPPTSTPSIEESRRASSSCQVRTSSPRNSLPTATVPAAVPPPAEAPVPTATTTPPPSPLGTAVPPTEPPPSRPDAHHEGEPDKDRDVDPELAALLPAARAARDSLRRDGRSLTRDSLAAQLRRDGHTMRTSRVSALLNLLRNDGVAVSVDSRRVSSPD